MEVVHHDMISLITKWHLLSGAFEYRRGCQGQLVASDRCTYMIHDHDVNSCMIELKKLSISCPCIIYYDNDTGGLGYNMYILWIKSSFGSMVYVLTSERIFFSF